MPALNYNLQYTHQFSACLFINNCCFNPVALFWYSQACRNQWKRYCNCFTKTNSTHTDLELTWRHWNCSNCHHFLQLQVGYTLQIYFHILFENGNFVAVRQCTLRVQTLNICTAIFYCIYRQILTNSSNKIKFTGIPLYFIL